MGAARALDLDSVVGQLDHHVLETLNDRQRIELERAIGLALPRTSPKLIDIRGHVPRMFGGLFVVFQVRRPDRARDAERSATRQIVNAIASWLCLLVPTLAFGSLLYMVKRAAGIDLIPGWHLLD